VARIADGAVMAKLLLRRTAGRVELGSLNPEFPELVFGAREVVWMHRIIWASQ